MTDHSRQGAATGVRRYNVQGKAECVETETSEPRDRWAMWRRGLAAATLAVLLAIILAFHSVIPNEIGNLGSLVDTFLPWFGWLVLPLAVWAGVRRSASAGVALLVPVLVWATMFAGLIPDKSDGAHDLRVLTHNVSAENPQPAETVDSLNTAEADVVALVELPEETFPAYHEEMSKEYSHFVQEGTVAVWSRHPLRDSEAVNIRMDWTRALRTTVETGKGDVAVYVAHLASVRVGSSGFASGQRDDTAEALGQAVVSEELESVVLLGDLNGTMQDRSLAPLASQLVSTQAVAGSGFGFTWPAVFPMARIDQILVRGMTPVDSWTLERTNSDHLPTASDLRF